MDGNTICSEADQRALRITCQEQDTRIGAMALPRLKIYNSPLWIIAPSKRPVLCAVLTRSNQRGGGQFLGGSAGSAGWAGAAGWAGSAGCVCSVVAFSSSSDSMMTAEMQFIMLSV
jgi:hypothetical protein